MLNLRERMVSLVEIIEVAGGKRAYLICRCKVKSRVRPPRLTAMTIVKTNAYKALMTRKVLWTAECQSDDTYASGKKERT